MSYRYNENNLGEFQEKDEGHWFTYRATNDSWALQQGFLHEIDVGPLGDTRFGLVKKTVVKICIDEDDEGKPVVDTWQVKKHNAF